MIKRNHKGITLLEAFLAAFLFVTSVAAIFVTMNALRKPAVNNERSLEGAMVLRNFLEDLRSKVDYRDYNAYRGGGLPPDYVSGPLLNRTNSGPTRYTVSGVPYDVYYDVALDSSSGAKQITARVNWPDGLN